MVNFLCQYTILNLLPTGILNTYSKIPSQSNNLTQTQELSAGVSPNPPLEGIGLKRSPQDYEDFRIAYEEDTLEKFLGVVIKRSEVMLLD